MCAEDAPSAPGHERPQARLRKRLRRGKIPGSLGQHELLVKANGGDMDFQKGQLLASLSPLCHVAEVPMWLDLLAFQERLESGFLCDTPTFKYSTLI